MKAAVRQLRIREILDEQEFVDVATLCARLETSVATVRRDLIALERAGSLKRVHGGALALETRDHHRPDFAWLTYHMPEEKRRIALLAVGLVEDGQTLILDGGSTVAAVARELVNRKLRIVTNSLPIADIFRDAPGIDVTLTGGHLDARFGVMLGPLCEQMLAGLAADVAIMGIGGVTERGFANNNELVVGSERKMIEVSHKVVIVADHTKFGRAAMLPLAPLEAADVVVSDTGLAPEHQQWLRDHGVEVRLA
jgi:DeoR/GlpR family transcriptional regulator of sugar metabolism